MTDILPASGVAMGGQGKSIQEGGEVKEVGLGPFRVETPCPSHQNEC